MKKNEIMAAVCKAVNVNADLIEMLTSRFDVEVSDTLFGMAIDLARSKYEIDLSAFNAMIVRHIYTTVVERYKNDLDESKFEWKADGANPYIKYDGELVKSDYYLRDIVREQKERQQDRAQLAAPRDFRLSDTDKKMLLEHGSRPEDLDWIELEANVCRYILNKPDGSEDHDIDREEAIKLMGRKKFLYNLDRTAFHWSTTEYDLLRGKRSVSFESGLLGRYHNKYNY